MKNNAIAEDTSPWQRTRRHRFVFAPMVVKRCASKVLMIDCVIRDGRFGEESSCVSDRYYVTMINEIIIIFIREPAFLNRLREFKKHFLSIIINCINYVLRI